MEKEKTEDYRTVTIEAACGGWVVKQKGRPAEVFVRWDALIRRLGRELTNKDGE